MSHILNENKNLKDMYNHLELLRQKNYSKSTIQEILEDIIPKNNEYQVKSEINEEDYTAYFSGYNKVVHINYCALYDYIINMQKAIIDAYPHLDKYRHDIFSYITLFTLCHEVEHVYQYLIGQEYIDFPYQVVIDGYKYVTDVHQYLIKLKQNKKVSTLKMDILIERFKQVKDNIKFILERNANLESYDLLRKLSLYENNEKLNKYFENEYIWHESIGYMNLKYNGSLEEAYKKLWNYKLYKTFNFEEEIPLQDKIRYGLPIENEDRIVLLKKFMETKE